MKIFSLFICAELFLVCTGFAQVNGHPPSDPILINGRLYIFHMPYGTGGNQFISGNEYHDGSLLIKGISYTGLKLNYDLYNQKVIMRYESGTGAINYLIVPDGWLEGFSLDGRMFKLISAGNDKKKIFQVIGDDSIMVLYGWKKKLELSHVHGAANHVFSQPVRTMYLYLNGSIRQYRSNKGFCSLLGSGKSEKVRDYLKRNKINVRKADDESIAALVSFCNSI